MPADMNKTFRITGSWGSTLRFCLVAVTCTACAISFLMLTATNPSANEVYEGLALACGGIGSYYMGRKLK